MKEADIIKFFAENGFCYDNDVFIGTNHYGFLPFNGSLLVGKYSDDGLLIEGAFKDSLIRKLIFDGEQVLIDVKDTQVRSDTWKSDDLSLKAPAKPSEDI